MNFTEELQAIDFNDLFDRLVAYAAYRVKSVDLRELDGKEPVDIVSDLFEKILTGRRNAENVSCSLDDFLFGCLKSDIDAFFRKRKMCWLSIADDDAGVGGLSELPAETTATKNRVIAELRNIGANEEEIRVFSIWAEGITKPSEVGTELGVPATDIYKIQRRLLSHLQDIHQKSKAFV